MPARGPITESRRTKTGKWQHPAELWDYALLSALAAGPATSESGQATRSVVKRLAPEFRQSSLSYYVRNLADLEERGLLTRDTHGKRTNTIAITDAGLQWLKANESLDEGMVKLPSRGRADVPDYAVQKTSKTSVANEVGTPGRRRAKGLSAKYEEAKEQMAPIESLPPAPKNGEVAASTSSSPVTTATKSDADGELDYAALAQSLLVAAANALTATGDAKLATENEALRKENEALRGKVQAADQNIATLLARIKEAEERTDAMRLRVEAMEAEVRKAKKGGGHTLGDINPAAAKALGNALEELRRKTG